MNVNETKSNYSLIAKLLHWGFVILFVYGVAKQVDELSQLEDDSFFKFEIIFAIIFLILLVVRFIYMKKTQKSSLPKETSHIQKTAAKIIHNGMYVLLLLTILSGLLIGFLFWLGLKNNFLINLVISSHELVINLLYIFIGIHILAASYHRIRKDGVWSSMVPFFKEEKGK